VLCSLEEGGWDAGHGERGEKEADAQAEHEG